MWFLMSHRVVIYVRLNVLRSCDLCLQAITLSQKCQDPAHKFFQGLTTQNYEKF
jgi:hypothetical protein